MKLYILLIALIPIACQPAMTSEQAAKEAVAPASCELLDSTATEQVFRFSDANTSSVDAGLGTECVSLGGGVFDCKPDACLVLPYTGTCPHCGGGGE